MISYILTFLLGLFFGSLIGIVLMAVVAAKPHESVSDDLNQNK